MTFPSGIIYEGEFNCNAIEGQGTLKWVDGSVYTGNFRGGIRFGKGVFVNDRDQVRYDGFWVDGKREGWGELTLADRSKYSGMFNAGVKHGEGKMIFPSGNFYEGNWRHNKKNGYGVMSWSTEKEIYSGEWREDYPHGVGNLVWLEDKGETKVMRNRYSGEFFKGNRQGLGVFYYANGATYEGEFHANKKHGYAVYTDENGVITKAIFDSDRIGKVIDTTDDFGNGMDSTRGGFPNPIEIEVLPWQKPIQEEQEENQSNARSSKTNEMPTPVRGAGGMNGTDNRSSILDGMNLGSPGIADDKFGTRGTGSKGRVDTTDISKLNPYMKFINIDDLLGNLPKGKPLFDKICQVLLRHNSSIKLWYKIYSRRLVGNDDDFKEGFYMRLSSFWQFLKDTRLVNGKLSILTFNRCFEQGYKNRFLLEFDKKYITKLIAETKKLDWENQIDNLHTSGTETKEKSAETEARFLEDLVSEEKFAALVNHPERPMLLRHFVDGILRA